MAKKENKEKKEPISLWFVLAMTALIAGMLFYALYPSERMLKSRKKLTYEEKKAMMTQDPIDDETLYSRGTVKRYTPVQTKTKTSNTPEFTILDINTKPDIKYAASKMNMSDFYKELVKYPVKSLSDAQFIVDRINEYNGYPAGIITVKERTSSTSGARIPGSYILGVFDSASGYVYIDSAAMKALPSQVLIPVLAHELDHFDKIIKVCKSMGVENYLNLLYGYNVQGVNADFWRRNAKYADISNFDSKKYEDALRRLLDRSKVDRLSSYADFYMLAEALRNPLEISAYALSDNLEKLYGLNKSEGVMRQLTKAFNRVDWSIYSSVEKDSILKKERPAVFDYFFAKAVMNKYPDTKPLYDNCVSQKNGDLTDFWLSYETRLPGFYARNGQIDKNTFYILLDLLKDVEYTSKNKLTSMQYTDALRFKVNTAKSNLVYYGLLDHLKNSTEDFLKYMFREKTLSQEDELNCFIILLCLENKIYKNNHPPISLYDLKIPEFLTEMYPAGNKKQKYNFIYNNTAFKSYCASRRAANPELSDQMILTDLLEKNALDLKTK